MIIEQMPLSRQLDMVFRELKEELASLASGTIFMQIRNNLIGKFGVKQYSAGADDANEEGISAGLTEPHLQALHRIGNVSLSRKRWTHGELLLQFALRHNVLSADVIVESNYNMANLLDKPEAGRSGRGAR